MVESNGALQNLDLFLIAYLPRNLTETPANIAHEDFLAIFRDPDDVVETLAGGVSRVAILAGHVHMLAYMAAHAGSLGLKPGV